MSLQAQRDRRKARVAHHIKRIVRDGRHAAGVRLAADLLAGEPAGRYCVSGLSGTKSMTFYTDDLGDATDRANNWADQAGLGTVITLITDLDH